MSVNFPKSVYLLFKSREALLRMLADLKLYTKPPEKAILKLKVIYSLCLSSAYCLFSCEAV